MISFVMPCKTRHIKMTVEPINYCCMIHTAATLFFFYLRGCPCKNRPLDFRPKTESLQIFCVRQLAHMINKNSNNLALSAVFQYF